MSNYYDYGTTTESASSLVGGAFAALGAFYLVFLAVAVFMIVCMWKVYKKAGKKGWESLIPIYNTIVMLEIAGLPTWYFILYFVPIANIYVTFKLYIELAHKFGQSTGFGIAMVFFPFICMPILAFGSATYEGTVMNTEANMNTQQPVNPQYSYTNPVQQPMQSEPVMQQPVGFESQMPQQPAEPVNQPFSFDNPVQPTVAPVSPVTPVEQPVQAVNETVGEPTVTDIPQANAEQVKFCPQCGNKTAMSADTCFMCGHKF